jgi:hypothetical protein
VEIQGESKGSLAVLLVPFNFRRLFRSLTEPVRALFSFSRRWGWGVLLSSTPCWVSGVYAMTLLGGKLICGWAAVGTISGVSLHYPPVQEDQEKARAFLAQQ